MKITFVAPFFGLPGGIRIIATYAKLLGQRGHNVTVISQPAAKPRRRQRILSYLLPSPGKNAARDTPFLADLDVEHTVLETRRPVVDADLPDADVIIATWWETAFWVAALSPAKGRKFYFIQHHEVHEYLPWQISRGTYYLPLKKITISQWLVDIMARNYGDTDVALVPNGIDTDLFHAPARARNDRPTIGLMYSTDPIKGTDTTLEAIRMLRARLPDAHVISFGVKLPEEPLLLPEGSEFHLKPLQTDIRGIYAACDVWVMGSRAEGFGLPILEAMACRTPVVSTHTGAGPDLVHDGVNGHVVNIEDSDAMAKRIENILSMSPEDWQAMSDAAYATAQHHDWEHIVGRFEQVLTDSESRDAEPASSLD